MFKAQDGTLPFLIPFNVPVLFVQPLSFKLPPQWPIGRPVMIDTTTFESLGFWARVGCGLHKDARRVSPHKPDAFPKGTSLTCSSSFCVEVPCRIHNALVSGTLAPPMVLARGGENRGQQ